MKLLSLLSSRKNLWLFSIIFIEGYVVLASELLAIRLLVPFVGSGTDTVSIVISAVLLPLAIGYHMGSSAHKRRKRSLKSLREVLGRNLFISLVFLCFGLSHYFLELFFAILGSLGITHTLLQTAIYSAVFLIWPIFLMGQTIPIISNYFTRRSLSEATGAMLFFSTIGSFLGSVFSTLVLMMVLGVNNTVIFTLFLLLFGIIIVKQQLINYGIMRAAAVWLLVFGMNSDHMFSRNNVYSNNAYSIVSVTEKKDKPNVRTMSVNRSMSSQVGDEPEDRFAYIAYIEDHVIYTYKENKPLKILVIGAGGFTLGRLDDKNHYTYVDIDPALKEVSEKYLLKKELGGEKRFVVASARAFLEQSREKYDIIVLDAYSNVMTIPAECVTKEFFEAIKEDLAPRGAVIANFVTTATYDNKFSARLFNTFTSVFPQINKQVINNFNPWKQDNLANNIYIYVDGEYSGDKVIYTDDKNTYAIDRY